MESVTREKRRRKDRGRSRQGCQTCIRRHVKCDEAFNPECKNCAKAGFECEGPRPLVPYSHNEVILATEHSMLGIPASVSNLVFCNPSAGQALDRFVYGVATDLSMYQGEDFWLKSALAASQSHSQVLNAATAVATVWDLPLDEALPDPDQACATPMTSKYTRQIYQQAMRWYSQSVTTHQQDLSSERLSTLNKVTLILMTSVLYTFIEIRQAQYYRINRLLKAGFAVVHSYYKELLQTGDGVLLQCLRVVLDISITMNVGTTRIPRNHRVTAIKLALKLTADMSTTLSNTDQLGYELLNIMYDVKDEIHERTDRAQELTPRMRHWWTAYSEALNRSNDASLDQFHARRFGNLFSQTEISWTAFNSNQHWTVLCPRLSAILELLKDIGMPSSPQKSISPCMYQGGIIPGCIFVAWYWRDTSILRSIIALLDYCDEGKPAYLESVRAYITRLVISQDPTSIEIELFGGKPRALERYQAHMCTQFLIEKGYQSGLD